MAEIAICLGVIAFALIAIIGILPSGLQTQRDNREETIVNQDARLLVEAIKSGGRDTTSDIGAYVVGIDNDGIDYSTRNPPGIPTTQVIQLLSDDSVGHLIVFSGISGGLASRGSDLGFRYQVTNNVVNLVDSLDDFNNSVLSNQVHEVRLRFAWPVLPNGTINNSEANRYTVRTLISGWHTNGLFYAQEYYRPAP